MRHDGDSPGGQMAGALLFSFRCGFDSVDSETLCIGGRTLEGDVRRGVGGILQEGAVEDVARDLLTGQDTVLFLCECSIVLDLRC